MPSGVCAESDRAESHWAKGKQTESDRMERWTEAMSGLEIMSWNSIDEVALPSLCGLFVNAGLLHGIRPHEVPKTATGTLRSGRLCTERCILVASLRIVNAKDTKKRRLAIFLALTSRTRGREGFVLSMRVVQRLEFRLHLLGARPPCTPSPIGISG